MANAYELTKNAAKETEKNSLQKLAGTDKTIISEIAALFTQNPKASQFSSEIKTFLNSLVSNDIGGALNNCNQNELGLLREIIMDNLKHNKNPEHVKIFKVLLDLIEANHFIRFI